MEAGREESNWKIAKWILASIEMCRTFDASKTKFDPDGWNVPERERRITEKAVRDAAMLAQLNATDTDPVRLAAIKAERIAEFKRFRSQFRG